MHAQFSAYLHIYKAFFAEISEYFTCQARHAARSWIICEQAKRLKWLCGTKRNRALHSSKNPHAAEPAAQRRSISSCIRFSTSAQRRRALQRSAAELKSCCAAAGELEGSRRRRHRVAITVRLRCCYASGAAFEPASATVRGRPSLLSTDGGGCMHARTKERRPCGLRRSPWNLGAASAAGGKRQLRHVCLSRPQGFAFAARSAFYKMAVGRSGGVQGTLFGSGCQCPKN